MRKDIRSQIWKMPPAQLEATSTKIAGMFSQLKMRAHAETKLKVRKHVLADLQEAIALDGEAEIAING